MERLIAPASAGAPPAFVGGSPGPHDLVRIAGPQALAGDAARPAWADAALLACPWVVVRRAAPLAGLIPVGIRGASRGERRAEWLPADAPLAVVTPQALAERRSWRGRPPRAPALAVLDAVDALLDGLEWGPAGSVGFELATGHPAVTAASDLDIVVRAPRPMDEAALRSLEAGLGRLPLRVDLSFETPAGSVALAELCAPTAMRAVKTPHGPRLLRDPWAASP